MRIVKTITLHSFDTVESTGIIHDLRQGQMSITQAKQKTVRKHGVYCFASLGLVVARPFPGLIPATKLAGGALHGLVTTGSKYSLERNVVTTD